MSHKIALSAFWRDLTPQLKNYFEELTNGMEVSDFEALKKLIVVYQIKQRLPVEMKENFIHDLPKVKNLDVLISELYNYEAARRSIRTINKKAYNFEDKKTK